MLRTPAFKALLLLVLLAGLFGCGRSVGTDRADNGGSPGVVTLPAPSEALDALPHGTSEVITRVDGADFEAALPNNGVTVVGTAARFNTADQIGQPHTLNSYSYAIYRLNIAGVPGAESLGVGYDRDLYDEINRAWFALANFETDRWEWHHFNVDPEGFGSSPLLMNDDLVAADGTVLAVAVAPPSLDMLITSFVFDTIDEIEDNDTFETAQPLPGLNFEDWRGSLGERDDQPTVDGDTEDWYIVDGELQEDQWVEFVISGYGTSEGWTVELVNPAGDVIRDIETFLGYGDTELRFGVEKTLEPTDMPLRIRVFTEDEFGGGNYSLEMRAGFRPEATVTGSTFFSPNPPVTVTFDGSGTTDPDGDIVSYSWRVREYEAIYDDEPEYNETFVTPTPTFEHTFTASGLYTITLTVTDAVGFQDGAAASVTVGPHPYDEIIGSDNVLDPGKSETGMLGSLGYWDEEFEDGVYAEYAGSDEDVWQISVPPGQTLKADVEMVLGEATELRATAYFSVSEEGYRHWWDRGSQIKNSTAEARTCFIRCSLIEGYYADYRVKWALGTPPTDAAYTYSATAEPLTIAFEGSGNDDVGVVRYVWDFNLDDIPDAEGQSIEHTFPAAGEVRPRLLIYDSDGLVDFYEDVFDVE